MTEPSRMRRWLRRPWLVLAIGVLLVASISLLTGLPQKFIAQWAIVRGTGMIADVEWGGFVPSLRIERIYLYHTAESYARKKPLVSVVGVRANYGELFGARKIDRLWIGQILIDADPADASLKDLEILKRDSNAPTNPAYI